MVRARLVMMAATTFAALAALVGCVPSSPVSSAPKPPTTPRSASPATPPPTTPAPPFKLGDLEFSGSPAPAVDRPSFPAPQVRPEGFAPAPAGDGLTGYLTQDVDWAPCGEGTTCAKVLAPLDYANPSAQAVTLSMRKVAATASPRLGTLFVNFGGPGASGVTLVPGFARAGLERFDIVGWDPRGVGESTSVVCYGGSRTDDLVEVDTSPETTAGLAALAKAQEAFGKSCWDNSGVLLEHISTIDTARDLDLLRALVGDGKLYYFGYSYGTRIGATYAELFGQNAARIVLDGAVDITHSDEAIQAIGFDLALSHFARWCADDDCSLGSSEKEVVASVVSLFDEVGRKPLKLGDRSVTKSLVVTGVAMMLYGGLDSWPKLAYMIDAAHDGVADGLARAADQLNDRDTDGEYGSLFYAFPAVSCLDDDDLGVRHADQQWAKDQRAAPVFGKYFGPDFVCALWPVRPARQLMVTARSAPPIVVIGGTGDNATPYQQAVAMADQLASGVLVTYDGEGHGAYGGESTCVDKLVTAYLVDGTVPRDGTVCT